MAKRIGVLLMFAVVAAFGQSTTQTAPSITWNGQGRTAVYDDTFKALLECKGNVITGAVSECHLVNGATLDQVMQALAVAMRRAEIEHRKMEDTLMDRMISGGKGWGECVSELSRLHQQRRKRSKEAADAK